MSSVQRKQMTTVDKSNIFPILADGTFDECQDIVKRGFKERSFISNDQYLLAINSINWIRIIGQICYYFYATLKINKFDQPINFSVPTGNFGNVFACYAASRMGMPLSKIIVAVNSNDILHRFFKQNDYSKRRVVETISPSMDISVASNFERLVYDFYLDSDSAKCRKLYSNFPEEPINIDDNIWSKTENLFLSYTCNDEETFECMKNFSNKFNQLIDPHTAVAYEAVERLKDQLHHNTVILATAHPAKFPDVLSKAGLNLKDMPERLKRVLNKKEVAESLSTSDNSIFDYIRKNN